MSIIGPYCQLKLSGHISIFFKRRQFDHSALTRALCVCVCVCVCVWLVAQSSLTLYGPMDCSSPGFSVHEIFQARILEWVTTSYCRKPSQLRDQTHVSCVSYIAGRFFTTVSPGKHHQSRNLLN